MSQSILQLSCKPDRIGSSFAFHVSTTMPQWKDVERSTKQENTFLCVVKCCSPSLYDFSSWISWTGSDVSSIEELWSQSQGTPVGVRSGSGQGLRIEPKIDFTVAPPLTFTFVWRECCRISVASS